MLEALQDKNRNFEQLSIDEFLNKKFKTNDDYILRSIADEHCLIPIGEVEVFENSIISLNETAAYLWNIFNDGCVVKDAISKALSEYEATYELIEYSVTNFILENYKFGLIREDI